MRSSFSARVRLAIVAFCLRDEEVMISGVGSRRTREVLDAILLPRGLGLDFDF